MAKKALLIGINYPGTAVELRGCVNDVRRMHRCLIDRFGFSDKDITVLIDIDKYRTQPTGKNIRDALETLIDKAEPGDILVFHYSGHGTRIPTPEGIFDATNFDECITPSDMNLITDNDFRDMLSKVKEGCKLTIISDSCHSGGLIENVKEQIGDSHVNKLKPAENTNFFVRIFKNLLAVCGRSSSQGDRGGPRGSFNREIESEEGETVTRYLPLDSYISLLEEETGETGIKYGKIRQTLVRRFGDNASPRVLSDSMKRNGHRGVFSMILGKQSEVNTGGAETGSSSSIPENGILLSGCQTDQRSEDVYVTRTRKAYGAFSDAIQTVLSQTRKGKKITNRDMVVKAREILRKQNFSQRPGKMSHPANYVGGARPL
ncbi:unnamed protein product [Microthlaspi erraticum]|uniref:Peptidase C14 caspase domain-containing protein n=1 Tax=Microthlaspi erraticum TaxID=1685480 RepID=A0A6D2KWD1_9BRAS|nr:unnamed protein product [Microthlaspi erraticum]